MGRLSSTIQQLKPHYEVVVVGSGYGGSIAACRLARAGQSVCLLERGKEFQTGEFPDTLPEAKHEVHFDTPAGEIGKKNGLYDFHVNHEINVFKGCGLGGTSLVNANVSLRAEPRVFEDECWPKALREDLGLLDECFGHAERMLGATPYPESAPRTPKLVALEKSSAAIEGRFTRPKLNVTFERRTNEAGVEQQACTLCGDCVTGCNQGAKNSTLMNYLPDAHSHGAEIFTEMDVRYVERVADGWLVHFRPLSAGQDHFDAPTMTVKAEVVILAGGTLGSTEILLRSRGRGLALSERLGEGFSGNGDVLGFGFDNAEAINGVGFGDDQPDELAPVGPCISGMIDLRHPDRPLDAGMVIEEGAIPGALAPLLATAFAGARVKNVLKDPLGIVEAVASAFNVADSLVRGPQHGAVHRTQTYLAMAHDDARGEMVLENDRLRIRWRSVGDQGVFQRVNDRLSAATKATGGEYIPNPIWDQLFQHDLVTVHPLGGCVMAESAEAGVVNHACQVFSGAAGTSVHEGLYVCDGAVIPRSLGVNPLLTISAIAERACVLIARQHGWTSRHELKPVVKHSGKKGALSVSFSERMSGWYSRAVTGDFQQAAAAGKRDNSPLEFVLTIAPDDLETMMSEPGHTARAAGTVQAPALSADPLQVEEGLFQLFVVDPDEANTRRMKYRLKLSAQDGRRWFFDGFKTITTTDTARIWHDTSTLYFTLYEGSDEQGPLVGKGILEIEPTDFLKQLTTMRAVNARSVGEELDALARFGKFFAGPLLEDYGGIFARSTALNPNAPPRRKRPLRAPAPEIHQLRTEDGVELRLTRYRTQSSRRPVVLVHGMGASSRLFNIDTIETNLLEYLLERDYDVWLFDWRGSILLEASQGQFDCDQVAKYDHPLAAAKLIELTGTQDIDWLVHCVGSISFFMSMLAGHLKGVRSIIALQVAANPIAPPFNDIKSDLHVPNLLQSVGLDALDAATYENASLLNKLFNSALNLVQRPGEECRSAVCHRISFLYSLCYRHAQLNHATHSALHELFGIANMQMMAHLATCTREGQVVAANGDNVYMKPAQLERLRLPITFLVGALNQVWKPEATQETYRLLCDKFGREQYKHVAIPDYGHLDPVFGKDAAKDVYPHIVEHLERVARTKG